MKSRRQKLRQRQGMSLTETLVAILLLCMFTLVVAVGINTAVKTRRNAVAAADVQTLSSTLSQALEDELRYAQNIRTSGDTVLIGDTSYSGAVFDSASFGPDVQLTAQNGRLYLIKGAASYALLGEKAYMDGLTAEAQVGYDQDTGVFYIQLKIEGPGAAGRTVSFAIDALNAEP